MVYFSCTHVPSHGKLLMSWVGQESSEISEFIAWSENCTPLEITQTKQLNVILEDNLLETNVHHYNLDKQIL